VRHDLTGARYDTETHQEDPNRTRRIAATSAINSLAFVACHRSTTRIWEGRGGVEIASFEAEENSVAEARSGAEGQKDGRRQPL
jgi:hypothetical protein